MRHRQPFVLDTLVDTTGFFVTDDKCIFECCREESWDVVCEVAAAADAAQSWELKSDHDLAIGTLLCEHDIIKVVTIEVTNEGLTVQLDLQRVVKRHELHVFFTRC